jgi:hypothetical protein
MSDPYFIFAVIMKELVVVYDNSVWAIRNHICNWEAVRRLDHHDPAAHLLIKCVLE